ncbi:Protein kinase-like domain [Pseudocohnilembus persalinus]|uniref:Protein kinase-like domain n=1 Tax=Pseudocohnilembus persalinus TaxID=266149 RepID=A0A0V0QRB0_PSEPJ|nr:Protein kinase-like domain [Pseudocohnilembus persalinus]|eukprot:KRX04748.1 Protein kinase-like domain [Pseudocohnilembus persalinus]
MLQQIWSNKDCLVQNQQNLVFYDPKLINLTGFIAKNQIVTTNEGFLLQNLIDEQQQLNNSNNQLDNQYNFKTNNKFNHFLGTENLNQNQQALLQEQYKENFTKKIIVKSISFLREYAFDQIFYHLIKMNKIKDEPGLLQAIGLSINETYDKDQFKLMIIYPKIDYNLTGIIRQNILIDIQDKLNISLQLAEGIKSLHDNNIFHGNLKPNNVLISRDFQIQINDWEFTQKFNSKHFSYVTGKQNKQSSLNENIDQLQPTNKYNNIQQQNQQISDENDEIDDDFEPFYLKGYVSPEQINQRKPRTSVLSDIWSLGMLYYYIFFGANNTQFNNQNLYNVQKLYDEQDIDLTQIYSKGTNNYLDKMSELIEKMVKYQPEQRIQIQKVRDILIQLFVNIKAENKQIFVDQ